MQWHLHNTGQSGGTPGVDIRAPEAWQITTGDPNIVVAVLDSGVDTTHPDLVDNLVPGYDFWDGDDDAYPALDHPINTHGTNCAGLIGAQGNDDIGVSGVLWNCKILPLRIAGVRANGTQYRITYADAATAIRWAASQGAAVLSNSWDWGQTNEIWHSAVVDVTMPGGLGRKGSGCLFFTASGNTGGVVLPQAAYPEVICVGGTDHNDVRCSYSSYGSQLDLVAPTGVGLTWDDVTRTKGLGWLWTTDIVGLPGWTPHPQNPFSDLPDYFAVMGGTSGACPIAAGVAALILSVEPNLTSDEVRHFLERSAKDLGDPGRDNYYGWGRVDARAALDVVLAYRCDLNHDWKVDEQDLAILNAAIDANDLSADIAPAAKRDGIVDANDLELLTRYLGTIIPEMSLIAHWKLDETEGTIVHDSAGEHHDATIMGAPLWQPEGGMVGGALQLSGVPNFATAKVVRNPSEGPLSVFAWVKGGGPGQVVISQQGGANWLMANAADGALKTELKSPGGQSSTLTSGSVITDGNWHRIGFTWDGSNRVLYVDDIEVARDTQADLAGSTKDLSIGTGSSLAPATFWNGLIDDVRIYDRAVKP